MTIPIGPLRFSISVYLAEDSAPRWLKLATVGMEDQELAHLNLTNTRYPEIVRWDHLLHLIGGTRRP